MSEIAAETSLFDLAVKKSSSRRDNEDNSASANSRDKDKFKTYMQSCFAGGNAAKNAPVSKRSEKLHKETVMTFGASAANAKDNGYADKQSIRETRMEEDAQKAASEEEIAAEKYYDYLALLFNGLNGDQELSEIDPAMVMTTQDVLDAAGEAVQLIRSLVFSENAAAGAAGTAGDAGEAAAANLQEILGALKNAAGGGSLTGSAAVGVASGDLATTNASAEMNIDAVMASLEELLDGMPQSAREQVLARAASELGLRTSTDGGMNNGAELLNRLQTFHTNIAVMQTSAENGATTPPTPQTPSPAGASTADQALNLGSTADAKLNGAATAAAVSNSASTAGSLLGSGLNAGSTPGAGASAGSLLGSGLDGLGEIAAASGVENGSADSNQGTGGQANNALAMAAGRAVPVPASASSMLDQMANIERLTELMRLNGQTNGVKNLTMQLSPPDLGKVLVRIESRNGVVSATFRVEQSDSATQLQNGMQQLRENLRAQGIEVGEFEVRYQDDMNADSHGGRRDRDPDNLAEYQPGGSSDASEAMDDQSLTAADNRRNPDGSLNLFV